MTTTWTHVTEVRIHAFLTSKLSVNDYLHAQDALPPGNEPSFRSEAENNPQIPRELTPAIQTHPLSYPLY